MEIGSEFWTTEYAGSQELFFVSGRTSLDFIIRDILANHTVDTAYLPAFCCHSMIEPFFRNGLSVKFYDISIENGVLKSHIPKLSESDVLFHMKYFGYDKQDTEELSVLKENGCCIIRDATHSWLTDEEINSPESVWDYSFISYRKWTGFTGLASATKRNGKFSISQRQVFHKKYEKMKLEAQSLKNKYITDGHGNKELFLSLFSKAEDLLDTDYIDYIPSFDSLYKFITLDKESIKTQRRENSQILLDGLSEIPELSPMFLVLGEHDVPLSVPIMVDPSKRDKLRKYLISNQIYCPVHWPISNLHKDLSDVTKKIYDSQLSLICDQRYGINDMKHIINCIKSFFEFKD